MPNAEHCDCLQHFNFKSPAYRPIDIAHESVRKSYYTPILKWRMHAVSLICSCSSCTFYEKPTILAAKYPSAVAISLIERLKLPLKHMQVWISRIRHQVKVTIYEQERQGTEKNQGY